MSADFEIASPLPGAAFGATVRLAKPLSQAMPEGLPEALADAGGLLLIPGLQEIAGKPELLVALSRLFGPEVEDYRYTLTSASSVHATVPEIFMVSNMAPVRPPPKRPDPPLTADGRLPVQYPHRKGWHTDQSYRRPPPDISLFYAVKPVARERGQTLFAIGHAGLRRAAGRSQGQGRGAAGPACPARHRPLARSRAGRPRRGAPSRRTSARSRSPWCARIRSPARRRSIFASAARWTGSTGRSSACSPARTATARPARRADGPLSRGRSSSMSTNGPRATCWSGTIAAWSTPRPW